MAVSRMVIDPSVAIKWYIPEENADRAGELKEWILGGTHRMVVPTLFFDEMANILWKKETLRKEFLHQTAREILWEILRLPLQVYTDRHELLPRAIDIARELNATAYDAIYLATATQNHALFVTADHRFFRRAAGTPFAASVRLLDEWKKPED